MLRFSAARDSRDEPLGTLAVIPMRSVSKNLKADTSEVLTAAFFVLSPHVVVQTGRVGFEGTTVRTSAVEPSVVVGSIPYTLGERRRGAHASLATNVSAFGLADNLKKNCVASW